MDPASTIEYIVKPGKCLIINNTKPRGNLALLLTGLNFEVESQKNLTVDQMIQVVKNYSKKEHTGVFVLVILSNGGLDNNTVYGTDGKDIPISVLVEYFKPDKCPSLSGVPKVFMVIGNDHNGGDSDVNTSQQPSIRLQDDTVFVTACNLMTSEFAPNLKAEIDEAEENEGFITILGKVIKKCGQQRITVEDTLTKKYCIKRNTIISAIQKNCKLFEKTIQEWLAIRKDTIKMCDDIIQQLIEHRRNVNIARITGSAAGIGGGALAIVGFGLAPFTFGASVALGLGGVALSTVGGVTVAGASIKDVHNQREREKEANLQYKKDQDKLKEAIKYAEKAQQNIDIIIQKSGNVDVKLLGDFFTATMKFGSRGANVGIKVAEAAVGTGLKVGALAFRTGSVAVRGLAIAGIAVNALLIPLDIAEIVSASLNMRDGNENNGTEELKRFCDQLKAQRDTIKEQL